MLFRSPAGRGREGRGRHPVYSPRSWPGTPPGNGLPGEGREVRTHPRPGRRPGGEGARLRPPLGIKRSPRLRGRARASLRSSALHRPRLFRVRPRHHCATHFTPISRLRRFRRPPSRGQALPRDKGCGPSRTSGPCACSHPAGRHPCQTTEPALRPGGGGGWPQAVKSLVFHMTKLTLTLKHPHSPFSLASS